MKVYETYTFRFDGGYYVSVCKYAHEHIGEATDIVLGRNAGDTIQRLQQAIGLSDTYVPRILASMLQSAEAFAERKGTK